MGRQTDRPFGGNDMVLYVLIRVLILAALIVIVRWLVRLLVRDSSIAVRFCVAFGLSALMGLAMALFGTPLPIAGASAAAILAVSLWGSARRQPNVRTAWIDMRLDMNNAAVGGRVLRGTFADADLDDLDEAALRTLMAEVSTDAESRRLLYDYCARRFGGKPPISLDEEREARNPSPAQGSDAAAPQMTRTQALEILGLQEGVQVLDIEVAYNTLIAGVRHEDGGSAYLESQIEAAKAVLLQE